jgi:gliding motility-associated-like protein
MPGLRMKKMLLLFLVLIITLTGNSQLCTGSLGDPVAWITFGTGPSSPLPSYSTTYTYVNSTCPNDGEYTLTDLTFGCFGSSWYSVIGDHTPNDANGRYMLVNASEFPGDFFTDTINGLCGNTTYELSAWIMNVQKFSPCGDPIKPNVTFHISTLAGTELVNYNSGDIPMTDVSIWKQFGTFLTTPPGVESVVIRITNNAPGGCGNDLALDDITFRPCGPTITATVATDGSADITTCESNEIPYLLTGFYTSSYLNPSLQWQVSNDNGISYTNIPGATSVTYLRPPTGVGTFKYRLTIAEGDNIFIPQCRIASTPITIIISPPPFVQATNYVFGCYGSTIILFASGGSIYQWTGPNGFNSNTQEVRIPNVQFTDAGLYKVRVTTFYGCSNLDSTNLVIYPAAHASINADVSICEGETVQLTASGGVRYKWIPNTDLSNDTIPNPLAKPKDSITYQLILFNQYNCFDTASVRVNVWHKPTANAGPDLKTLVDKPIRIKGSGSGTLVTYSWMPNLYMIQSNTMTPVVNPPQTMSYLLQVSSTLGCGVSSDEVIVKVFDKLQIPNVFTPNGDGINDKWEIELLDLYTECNVEIFNRYGQVVFHSIGYEKPWNGTYQNKPVPAGTYYYVIDTKVARQILSGFVDVVR